MINKYLIILLILLSFINIKNTEDSIINTKVINNSVLSITSKFEIDKDASVINCITANIASINDSSYCYDTGFITTLLLIENLLNNNITTASITAIKYKNNIRYLTSDHVCEEIVKDKKRIDTLLNNEELFQDMQYVKINNVSKINSIDGKNTNLISIINRNEKYDICEIKIEKDIVKGTELSNKNIFYGINIYNASSPRNLLSNNRVYIEKGIYLGDKNNNNLFNLTIYEGSSGSPIFYKNEIISIIFAYNRKMKNVSYGTKRSDILEFISNKN